METLERLYLAVSTENTKLVKSILNTEAVNPNKITSHGKTCLGEASWLGNATIVNMLLAHITHMNIEDVKNKSPRSMKRKHSYNHEYIGKITSKSMSANHLPIDQEHFMDSNELIPSAFCSPTNELEWDENIGDPAPITKEDESYTSLYEWYAAILESTGEALAMSDCSELSVDHLDAYSKPALHYAVDRGHEDIVELFIKYGSKLDVASGDGRTALHLAASKNDISIANLLLTKGSNVNIKTHRKFTALHFAADSGHYKMVKLLVAAGADVNTKTVCDQTALHMASAWGYIKIVEYLATRGSNVNYEDMHGYTALCKAVWRQHGKVVKVLLERGARVTYCHRLLHHAVRANEKEIVSMLIDYGGGVNLFDENGDTPLLLACRMGFSLMVEMLLDKGANINIANNISSDNALHVVIENVNDSSKISALIKCLIERGIDMNTIAWTGDTALNRALLLQKDYAAELLIKCGADVNACDLQACVLDNLTIACRKNSPYLANLLIKAGHRYSNNFYCATDAMVLVHEAQRQPLTLMDWCRLTLRTPRDNKIMHLQIMEYPLPILLKRFLLMEDVT